MNPIWSAGATTAVKSTSPATVSRPSCQSCSAPPSTVVDAWCPTAVSPSIGTVFATTYSAAAASANASVRWSESSRRRQSSLSQRGQRADAPGARSGRRCRRSQSGQAMNVPSETGWLYTPLSTLRPNVRLAISRQTPWRIRARSRRGGGVGSVILPHELTKPSRPAPLAERLEPQCPARSAALQRLRPRAPRPVPGGARMAVADRALALPPHGNRDRAPEPRRHDERPHARPGELRRAVHEPRPSAGRPRARRQRTGAAVLRGARGGDPRPRVQPGADQRVPHPGRY